MKKIQKIIITILAIVGACVPFGLAFIVLKPIPRDFELPLVAQVFSFIGVLALLLFTFWLICFVVAVLWEKRGD